MGIRFSWNEAIEKGFVTAEEARAAMASVDTRRSPALPSSSSPASSASTQKPSNPGRSKKRDIEGDEQAIVIGSFREAFPEIGELLIHIPNGGSRKNKFEGWRLKQQGARAGVSDLFLPVARGGYHWLWIEFKATPPNDAAVSPEQCDWIERMTAQGYFATVAKGVDAAMQVLRSYVGLP